VNDDPVLDLFPFDAIDPLAFWAEASGLNAALALSPTDPLHPLHPAYPLGPTGGGFPRFWENIDDIIGGAGDLLGKMGEMFKDVWDAIWKGIGGAIRWVWDWMVDIVDWLNHQLLAYFTWVGNLVNATTDWVWHQVEHWGGVVRDKVGAMGDWVWHQVEHWGGVVRDKVEDMGDWIWHQVEHWGGVVRDKVEDMGDWVWHQVEHWGGVVRDKVEDMGDWIWHQVEHWGGVVRDKVEDSAGWVVDNVVPPIMGAMESVGDLVAAAIKWPWEHIFDPFIDVVEGKLAIPGKLLRGEYSSMEQFLDDALDPAPLILAGVAGLFILVMVVTFTVQLILQTLVTPMALPYQQDAQARVGAELLTVGVVQDALNRGFIDEGTADDHLSRMGYSGSAKQAILELRNIIPGPTDLVRMAVREVFTPQLRQELTLDAEFPAPFADWAAKLGISEEWAGNYWAAHWDLPSPSQGYEMLHRGLITDQQLADLLKALDYAPVWRDKLQAISYNPITRVDLRRLFKMGIITEAQVKDGYKALGYNDERAGWLTEFTKRYYGPDEGGELKEFADLAQSTIRLGYRRHVLSREEALDKLVEAGYSEDVADFLLTLDDVQLGIRPDLDADVDVREFTSSVILTAYRDRIWDRDRVYTELQALGYLPGTAELLLSLEDYKLQRELTDLEETVVKEEYLANAVDRQAASTRLDALDVLPDRRDLLLQRWDLDKAQSPRRLTVGQMQTAFRAGLLTDVQLLAGISALGYNDTDAKLLVDMTDKEPESTARRLSVGQLQRAYKAGLITDAQLLDQLLALQYSEEDAKVLVDMATPAAAAKERQLSASQLTTGFRAGLVTEDDLLQKLVALGYPQADAELLRDIAAQKPEPEPRRLSLAQLKASYKAELITKSDLLVEVLALGYTDRDAGWLVTLIAPAE
jgi:hypothetical protein